MQAFKTLSGTAIPFGAENIDTDVIVASRFLKTITRSGLGKAAFSALREDPDNIFDNDRNKGAPILIAGDNFGCGSSREHAVWALAEHGIRAVIAPSFSPIFAGNAVRGGVLPLVLPRATIAALAASEGAISIDLPAQTVTAGARVADFNIDAEAKAMLIGGLDAIDLTLQAADRIADWQRVDRQRRPWVYLGG